MRVAIDPSIFGEEHACFGCAPHNPHGLQLRFHVEGDEIVTTLDARDRPWSGPPGILHGGLQATLADEVGAWALVGLLGHFGFTSSAQLRWLRPAKLDLPLEGRARILSREGATVSVRVTLSQEGRKVLAGTFGYVIPTVAMAEKMLGRRLPDAWRALALPDAG